MTKADVLLLVESDPTNGKKNLVRENGEQNFSVGHDRKSYATMGTALLSRKKLARSLKTCDMLVIPHSPCLRNKEVNKR